MSPTLTSQSMAASTFASAVDEDEGGFGDFAPAAVNGEGVTAG